MGTTKRGELLELFPGILFDMPVRDQEGHRLGKVVAASEDSVEIRTGLLFPQYFLIDYTDITESDGKSLYVALGSSVLKPVSRPEHTAFQPDNKFQTQKR